MPRYLKPMVWPAAVPLLTPWQGDYADIRDHIRRTGSLDISEDTSEAGNPDYGRRNWSWPRYEGVTFRRLPKPRLPTLAERLQREHEAEQFARQRAKEEAADKEWAAAEKVKRAAAAAERAKVRAEAIALHEQQQTEAARRYWSAVDPIYGRQTYHNIAIGTAGTIRGVRFEAGGNYLVPRSVAEIIRGHKPDRPAAQPPAKPKAEASRGTVEDARASWSAIDPTYAAQTYYHVTVGKTVMAYGVSFQSGQTYWVPAPVVYTIRGLGG